MQWLLKDVLELDEDTVRAIKVGGEWIEVQHEANAVSPAISNDESGWLSIKVYGESDELLVPEAHVQAVKVNFA